MHTGVCTTALPVLQNETPTSPDMNGKSTSFKSDSSPATPMSVTRPQVMHDRKTWKHDPYHSRTFSSALMSRHSTAHLIERGRQRELSVGDGTQRHKLLVKGLSRMSSSALYEGYKVQLVARETARQRLLLTAWEIEEAERLSTFLGVIHAEDERWLGWAEEELQAFRDIFLQRSKADVGDDKDYLQAVYEDECEVLRITSAEADDLANILDKRLKHPVSRFTRDYSWQSKEGFCVGDEDVSEDSDTTFEGSVDSMGVHHCHRDRDDKNLDNPGVGSEESDD